MVRCMCCETIEMYEGGEKGCKYISKDYNKEVLSLWQIKDQ